MAKERATEVPPPNPAAALPVKALRAVPLKRCYGKPFPGADLRALKGRLVVVEGGDGAGRSTQIALLKEFLELQGYPAVDVGLKRSKLVSEELRAAMGTNLLSPRTLSLLYATDFADQLEHVIVPSLRAGFVVIADRYIYTLMARGIVRGADAEWIRGVYDIAIVPDRVFYLRVRPRVLAERTFQKRRQIDYWESGQDIERTNNLYEGFLRYQGRVQKVFKDLEPHFPMQVLDGELEVRAVQEVIRAETLKLLQTEQKAPAAAKRPLRRPATGLRRG